MSIPSNNPSPAIKAVAAPGNGIPDPSLRTLCNTLRLFQFCPRAACRKARACRGDPVGCLDARPRELIPERVFKWASLLHQPGTDNKPVDVETRKRGWPTEHVAYESWIAGFEAGGRSRAAR